MPSARRPAILFAEDFDVPAGVTVPGDPPSEPAGRAPPVFSEADLAAVREQAYADGLSSGLAQAAADRAEVTRQMLGVIAERLDDARAEAARVVEESAEAVARLLLGVLATMLPELCARHGAAEVAALTRAVLPTLAREPRVAVRVSPLVARAVEQEIARLDPELQGRISLVANDGVPPGDARIAWSEGAVVRDAASLWRAVADALAPLDLLPAEAAAAA